MLTILQRTQVVGGVEEKYKKISIIIFLKKFIFLIAESG